MFKDFSNTFLIRTLHGKLGECDRKHAAEKTRTDTQHWMNFNQNIENLLIIATLQKQPCNYCNNATMN